MFLTTMDEFDFKPLGKGLVRLQGELRYKDVVGEVAVPDRFECDLASYPDFARAIFDRLGSSMRPAFVHDYLYREGPDGFSRRGADRIFRQALLLEGASKAESWSCWLGVRLVGWRWWVKPD